MLFFHKHCLLQWMKNALKIKQFEKLSAVRLLDFFKTGVHREETFFKVLSTLVLQQNCICRLYSEEVKALQQLATEAFKEKIRPCYYSFRNQSHPMQKPRENPYSHSEHKEPTWVSFPISHRQTIKKLSLNQCSWKKNMQGKILSVGLSALKIQKA